LKKLTSIFILIVVLASCESKTKTKPLVSSFNLKKDFTQLTHKITELDTIVVWMDMSLCMSQGIEVLTITRKKDSLTIQPKHKESLIIDAPYKRGKTIRISIHDTLWKFNQFLKRNENKITTNTSKYGRLQIYHKTSRLNFITERLSESGRFIADYCNTMSAFTTNNPLCIYENSIIME
jgi:hypothetical protein